MECKEGSISSHTTMSSSSVGRYCPDRVSARLITLRISNFFSFFCAIYSLCVRQSDFPCAVSSSETIKAFVTGSVIILAEAKRLPFQTNTRETNIKGTTEVVLQIDMFYVYFANRGIF